MAHIQFKHGYQERAINTDQIVTATREESELPKRSRVTIITTVGEYIFIGDSADEFWEKYQRACVARERSEVG